MNNGVNETKNGGYITGSGRRFVSDTPKEFHYTSFETKRLLRAYAPESEVPLLYKDTSLAVLEPHAVLNREKLVVSFCIRSEKGGHSYVLKDISELLDAIEKATGKKIVTRDSEEIIQEFGGSLASDHEGNI